MQIRPPKVGPFEINLNTIVVLLGFAAGFITWGYTLSELKSGRALNSGNIDKLEARIVALETNTRRLDNHELRLTTTEAQVRDSATAMKAVDATLSALTTDVRVVREILTRLEASQNGGRASAQ